MMITKIDDKTLHGEGKHVLNGLYIDAVAERGYYNLRYDDETKLYSISNGYDKANDKENPNAGEFSNASLEVLLNTIP